MNMTSDQVIIWATEASRCMKRNRFYFDVPYYYTTHSNDEHVKQLNTWIDEVAPFIHGFYKDISQLEIITGNVGFEYISVSGGEMAGLIGGSLNIIIKQNKCRRELNIPIEAFNQGVESIPRFVALDKMRRLENEMQIVQSRIDRDTESLQQVFDKLTNEQDEFYRLYGRG